MGNSVDENLNYEKDRYERQRRRENENRLSNSIYRIDYENYLKRKRDSEGKVAELLLIVEEKRTLLEKEKAEKDRVNSHGDYYYRNRMDGEVKTAIVFGGIFSGGLFLAGIGSFFINMFPEHEDLVAVFPSIGAILYSFLYVSAVILLRKRNGKKNKEKMLTDIENNITAKLRDLQRYEKELADAQAEYEMIIKSEPKRENY